MIKDINKALFVNESLAQKSEQEKKLQGIYGLLNAKT